MSIKARENSFQYTGMFTLFNLYAVWPDGRRTMFQPRMNLGQLIGSVLHARPLLEKIGVKLAITKIRDDRGNLVGEIQVGGAA